MARAQQDNQFLGHFYGTEEHFIGHLTYLHKRIKRILLLFLAFHLEFLKSRNSFHYSENRQAFGYHYNITNEKKMTA